MRLGQLLTLFLCSAFVHVIQAQESQVLIENVKLLDYTTQTLTPPKHVLINGNTIQTISTSPIAAQGKNIVRIDAKGKTLIPGLIDVHVHLVFGALTMPQMMTNELSEEFLINTVGLSAQQMLMRGFTSVRDVGGPIFPLKAAIDKGKILGPRIWPSGAVVSQTAGHGDFRTPEEKSRRFFGVVSRAERYGATFIADGRDEVLTAVRENLRFGASQIKLMAGGGTSSAYDPVDVTQYTLDEMKAAVEAAEDWGTYVTVHAYTPRAIRRAIEAGVKCIEHGQLLDEETLQLIAKKNIWLSLQNLVEDTPDMDPQRRIKRKPVIEGQEKVWPMAKKYGVKLAWGTDFLFEPDLNKLQNTFILRLQKWFTNVEIIKMITQDNGELLQLSGLRSPYPGKLGIVEEGALADLILVDGDPLKNLKLLADPEKNFLLIMKDGQIHKNSLQKR
ncbi:amidohydrolase family protein [Sphingobacterium paramultivorum]|uniref:Amidohydrolase family protein n=1 Tax=Sphingobacterium paramultivorum TaxID=2886510 RepID=A0A7G5E7I9_9SPHI|nr:MULTISPECIES: amidohydrolase family protein [Sphingobacterium]MCS4166036.1 imidazolonepropionase-like amidohydrolase [Sphingobacterium sp. BIGb0116]QMV69964.1 amidohydrolase family protein [Sphingobacterium paramultivorum]WSO13793.1 amidohydrolase family protein [Sphingobacterium paramultivorum]